MDRNIRGAVFIGLLSAGAAVGNAHAGTVAGTMAVSAMVAATCTATAATLTIGNYDVLDKDPTLVEGTMTVTCTKGTKVSSIALNSGNNASGTQKRMLGATSTDLLNYRAVQPTGVDLSTTGSGARGTCPGTMSGTEWGSSGANLLSFSGNTGKFPSNTTQTIKVCGQVPAGQNVAADTYTDTVGVTVTFN